MSLRATLLRLSIPIQKFLQKLHPPEPETTIAVVSSVYLELEPGDILLSREAWHFTNLFIPGFWSHAAIVSAHSDGVIEAVAPQVRVVNFADWAIRKHNWCVIRPNAAGGRFAAENAQGFIGREYDYLFDHQSDKAFFCSELVFLAWLDSWQSFDYRRTWGKWTVTPDDFYQAALKTDKARIIYEHLDGRLK